MGILCSNGGVGPDEKHSRALINEVGASAPTDAWTNSTEGELSFVLSHSHFYFTTGTVLKKINSGTGVLATSRTFTNTLGTRVAAATRAGTDRIYVIENPTAAAPVLHCVRASDLTDLWTVTLGQAVIGSALQAHDTASGILVLTTDSASPFTVRAQRDDGGSATNLWNNSTNIASAGQTSFPGSNKIFAGIGPGAGYKAINAADATLAWTSTATHPGGIGPSITPDNLSGWGRTPGTLVDLVKIRLSDGVVETTLSSVFGGAAIDAEPAIASDGDIVTWDDVTVKAFAPAGGAALWTYTHFETVKDINIDSEKRLVIVSSTKIQVRLFSDRSLLWEKTISSEARVRTDASKRMIACHAGSSRAYSSLADDGVIWTRDADGIITGANGGHLMGRFSDGKLWMIARAGSGSSITWTLWTSDDFGVSWTAALTIISATNLSVMAPTQFGDKIYCYAMVNGTVNQAAKFFRIDYAAGTPTLGVNNVQLKAAKTNHQFNGGQIAKEPGGRLWCAVFQFQSGVEGRLSAEKSDDDGATWANSNDGIATSGGFMSNSVACISLDKNTIIGFQSNSGGAGIWTSHRAHTDAVGTWPAAVRRIAYTSTTTGGRFSAALLKEAINRNTLMTADEDTSPAKVWGLRISEDAGGVLTFTSISNFSIPSGDGAAQHSMVSGRKDGWRVYYSFPSSLHILRFRDVTSGATVWPAESSDVSPYFSDSHARLSTAFLLDFNLVDLAHLVIASRMTGGLDDSLKIGFAGFQGEAFDSIIPLLIRSTFAFDSVIPLLIRRADFFDQLIPISWELCKIWIDSLAGEIIAGQHLVAGKMHCTMRADQLIPILIRQLLAADNVIPIQFGFNPFLLVDHIIPIAIRAILNADEGIPIQWSIVDAWIKQAASQADVFAPQASSESDVWVKDPASQPESWTPQGGSA